MVDRFDVAYIDRALNTWESVKDYWHLHTLVGAGDYILEQERLKHEDSNV